MRMGVPEPAIATDQGAAMIAPVPPDQPGTPGCGPAVDCAPLPPGGGVPPVAQTRELVLTKATVTLNLAGGYGEKPNLTLVPAYQFATEDGGDVVVDAVTDKFRQTEVESTPSTDGAKPGGGSGGGSTEPGEPPPAGTDGQSCSVQMAKPAPNEDGSANAPLELEVCGSDGKVKVGDEVTFTVKAKDADGSFTNSSSCDPPVRATFGDEDGNSVSCAACSGPTKDQHEFADKFSHKYEKPGTYEAVFNVHSGSTCEPRPGDSKGQISLAVEVTR